MTSPQDALRSLFIDGVTNMHAVEEQAMAQWIDESLPMVTRHYAALYAESGVSTVKI